MEQLQPLSINQQQPIQRCRNKHVDLYPLNQEQFCKCPQYQRRRLTLCVFSLCRLFLQFGTTFESIEHGYVPLVQVIRGGRAVLVALAHSK